MMGIRDGGLIKPNRKMHDNSVGAFTAMKLTTLPLNVLKCSLLVIKGGFLAESNYVLIALVTDIELIAVEVTDVRIVKENTTHRFVTKPLNQLMEGL